MDYKNIGKKIKEKRQTLQLTQKELARKANVDLKFLGNIERGVSKPSVDTLVKISQALDIPLDILVAEHIIRKNLPENYAITKEVVKLVSILSEYDSVKILQLIRYSIELFTGKPVNIPRKIQSHLKDDREVLDKESAERLLGKAPKKQDLQISWKETKNKPEPFESILTKVPKYKRLKVKKKKKNKK